MITESAIGGGVIAFVLAAYKILNVKIDKKVNIEWCEKLEKINCTRMTKGDEKFEKIMDTLQKHSVSLGEIVVEMKNLSKTINLRRDK